MSSVPPKASPSNGVPAKRIAAIDLGTNSFHTVIVDIYPDRSFRTVDKLKEMVNLAGKGMQRRLGAEAMERGLSALRKIRMLCDSLGVEDILAYATSAIREAEDGGEFIQRMIDEIGIKAHAISGMMEARLIARAVMHAVTLDEEPVLMADIGGGSVELTVAGRDRFHHACSLKIGVARMAAEYVASDPLSKGEIKKLRARYRRELEPMAEVMEKHPVRTLIGTSGTMENIALMIAARKDLNASLTLNELEFRQKDYRDFYREFINMDRRERLTQKGLEEKRVDIIAPGVVLLDHLIRSFGIDRIKISEFALREGMILHYIDKQKEQLDMELKISREIGPDPRRRSVHELLRKCDWHESHSRHVTDLALQLFDALQQELKLPEGDRELLEYASLMHDIGYYISHRKHHKHALYLIRNADLKGFREDEINLMANVARYHRRSTPKKRHKRFRKLDKPLKSRVRRLSALLRVADGLDRSHYQNVRRLEIERDEERLRLLITTEGDPELEIWGAMRKRHLFEEVTGCRLEIHRLRGGEVVETEQPDPFPEYKS
ncbi:MAG: Ppx/GppA phosphatase family protein [Balneolaceae bacterium]|nr:Ppx/GppA phosphatase family protein [Balneolaceae bacterium]